VQLKKRTFNPYLLAIYLLAVLQSISLPLPPETLHHHHKDFEAVHHTHTFHIGIFHFIGHLLEKIGQHDNLKDDYLQPAIVLSGSNVGNEKDIVCFDLGAIISNLPECSVNINDPPNFLPYLSLLQKVNFSSNPLRAPPSFC